MALYVIKRKSDGKYESTWDGGSWVDDLERALVHDLGRPSVGRDEKAVRVYLTEEKPCKS